MSNEMVSFQIISNTGSARSNFIEAIREAKAGNFEKAEQLMAEGRESLTAGHAVHSQLITQEAKEGNVKVDLLLVHAEDQMMAAEVIQIIASELIELHEKVK